MKEKRGFVHIYTGDGKGKTTAALGMAIRAAGWGWRVLIIQFLKGGKDYGERKAVDVLSIKYKGLSIKMESCGRKKFVDPKKLTKKDFEEVEKAIKIWETEMKSGKWEMIILDEINVAIKFGLVSLEKVLTLIKEKPRNIELVLTGRWAHPKIKELADYVSEIKEIKHPYKKKIKARKGVEY